MSTAWTTADLEACLARALEAARSALLETLGANLHAIVLGGGFARGEGSLEQIDGEWVPANDLDLFLILEAPTNAEELARARARALGSTRVRDVDLLPRLRGDLARLPLSLENLELRDAHRVVHGPADVLDAMPRWHSEDLPLFEAENLLRNRLVTLLEGCPGVFGASHGARICAYQSAKAALAAVDARLLRARRHATSYAEKVARFSALADGEERRLAEESLAIKRGELGDRSAADDEALWHRAARLFVRELLALFRSGRRLDARVDADASSLARLARELPVRSVSPLRTLRRLARALLGGSATRHLDACLLALVVERSGDHSLRLPPRLFARAELAPHSAAPLDERVRAAVARWYALRKPAMPASDVSVPTHGAKTPSRSDVSTEEIATA